MKGEFIDVVTEKGVLKRQKFLSTHTLHFTNFQSQTALFFCEFCRDKKCKKKTTLVSGLFSAS